MESKTPSKNAEDLVHFIAYIRTALAMALIRSKPPDLSVISYATNICGKFNKAQLRLKTKLDRSRQELLTLQQQLVMEQARSLNTSPAHTSNEGVAAAAHIPTPPCSFDTLDAPDEAMSEQHGIHHAMFLKSLVELKAAARIHRGADDRRATSATVAASKSVHTSIDVIGDWLCMPDKRKSTNEHLIDDAIAAMLSLVEAEHENGECRDDVTQAVLGLVQRLLTAILNTRDSHSSLRQQEELSAIIIKFMQSRRLIGGVLQLLMTSLTAFTDTLRRQLNHCSQVPSHHYDNMYHVLALLEQAIVGETSQRSRPSSRSSTARIGETSRSAYDRDDVTLLLNIKAQMDESVLHLCDTHPLLCHYIWHLVALIGDGT